MPFTVPWGAVLKYGLPAILLAIAATWVTNSLIDIGEARIQAKWDADVENHQKEVERLKNELAERQETHRERVRTLNNALASAELRHASDIAALRSSYALRLRESEDRADIYQRLADSGSVGRANLASYAAQLDRSLVEGRQVVEELRATVIQRDDQLRALGRQLEEDRRLINGPSE